jgi:transcriptional regulator with XRE-family HTH domain
MYHDQGLIPFKTLDMSGVNYTAGLSVIRTSPDHGTGFDIAGKNMADLSSMRNALYMAGKTQAELAKAVNVTEVSVSKWMNGVNVPRPNKVDEICRVLRCSREDLMVDHDRQVILAPEDVLAEEMRMREDLYTVFNALINMNDSDLKLVTDLIKRLSI